MSAPTSHHSDTAVALWRRIFDGGSGYIYVLAGVRAAPSVKKLTDEHTQMFPYPHAMGNAEQWLIDEAARGREVYAGAALFEDRTRGGKRENVGRMRACYVDGDGATVPPHLPASTITVESSPGRTQEYWILSRAVEPVVGEEINRRLAYAIGADKSGWDTNQLLRVPGFPNRKYAEQPIVTILRDDGPVYDPDELLAALPSAPAEATRVASGDEAGGDCDDEPPIAGMDRSLWCGEKPAIVNGAIDNSGTLWHIAGDAEEHGATLPLIAWIFEDRDRALGINQYVDRPYIYREQARKVVNRVREPVAVLRPKRAGPSDTSDAEQFAILQGRLLHINARVRQNGAMKHYASTGIALACEAVSAEERGRLQPDGSFVAWIGDVITPMAGVSRQSVSKHLKKFEQWGLLTLGYRFVRQPIVDTATGEVIGEREVVRGCIVKLTGSAFAFLEALATFIPPKVAPQPHQHCHPELATCRRPCCQGDAEPDVTPFDTKDVGHKREACGQTSMSTPFTSGSKDPREGFTTCATCGDFSRHEVCPDCAVSLGGRAFWASLGAKRCSLPKPH